MNYKSLLALVLAGSAFTALAQTHAEGMEYFEAGQLANAKELLLRNHNNATTDKAISFYYQGQIALIYENKGEALKLFNEGVAANAEYPMNYIGLGLLDLMAGNAKQAEENFKKAESLGKKDAGVQIAIARAYDAVNPNLYAKEIAKKIDKARKIDMKDPAIYIFEGDQLAKSKDYGAAGAKYEMALNYDPNATAAYFKYANLFSQVNPEYGIAMLQKLLELNPQSALGQRSLANAYYDQSMYKEAASEYGKYVNNPNHFKQDEDRYAFLLFYGGDYQKGYDYATALLQKDPSNFSAKRYQFMNAAQIPAMADKLLPMAEALYAAHTANPDANVFAPIDYTLIGDEFKNAKRLDEAKAVFEEGIRNLPTNSNLYKNLAMLNVERNDMPGASTAFDGYLENTAKPGFNDFWQAAIFAYYAGVQQKDSDPTASNAAYDKALSFADKAQEAYPSMYRSDKMRGDVAMMRGNKDEALGHYIEAVKKLEAMEGDTSRYAADAKNLYNAIGNAYLDKNDKESAKRYFNGYLKYDPDNADYRKFVESL